MLDIPLHKVEHILREVFKVRDIKKTLAGLDAFNLLFVAINSGCEQFDALASKFFSNGCGICFRGFPCIVARIGESVADYDEELGVF